MAERVVPRRVALIFGGVSPEHDVSISSASQVAEGLHKLQQRLGIAVQAIYINPDGEFVWDAGLNPRRARILGAKQWELESKSPDEDVLAFPDALVRLVEEATDVAMLILHGPGGEDGRLQAALDLARIRYTGSGAAASALALHKPHCQAVLNAAGVPIAASIVLGEGPTKVEKLIEAVGVPCVVKPASGGSSVGVTIVRTAEDLQGAIEVGLSVDDAVMVEKFIGGREVTCGVLEIDGEARALPVTEIVPPEGRFFDYDAKYLPGMSREVTPADLPVELSSAIQTYARLAHLAVGCRGFSRTDFIVGKNGRPVALEINTIPGMTETSLLPQQAAAIGITFDQLLERMLESAAHD